MELFVKHFSELTAQELFEIYRLRVSVFVVEQKCCYQEVNDADENAYHVWLRDKDGIEACILHIFFLLRNKKPSKRHLFNVFFCYNPLY